MVGFILHRAFWAIPTLIFVSLISFFIIQLPPGDYVTAYVAQLRNGGEYVTLAQEEGAAPEHGTQ